MSNESIVSTAPAERVSRDSINRINFLTGSSINDLRNVVVVVVIKGRLYEVHFDEEGRVQVRSAK